MFTAYELSTFMACHAASEIGANDENGRKNSRDFLSLIKERFSEKVEVWSEKPFDFSVGILIERNTCQ
jgi:hypothetical protein